MTSPTELSDTILDALTYRYGSDLRADVFTDEQANQIPYLKFADTDRYALRIEARETPANDPSQAQDFGDPHTGAHARITAEALMIFIEPDASRAANPERGKSYMLYPLHKILMLKSIQLPGGQIAVYIALSGEEQGPGLNFTDSRTAAHFEQSLKDAIGQP